MTKEYPRGLPRVATCPGLAVPPHRTRIYPYVSLSDLVRPVQRIEGIMKRLLILLCAPLLFFVLFAAPAFAAGAHFTHGGVPTCTITPVVTATDTSQNVTCSGELAGLGNVDLVLDLSASGFALYQCQNGGGNIAPGQNKVLVGPATSTTSIPASAIKNGRTPFTTNAAVLSAPLTVGGAVAGCPNANWSGVNPVVTVTSITLKITQTNLLFTCTKSDPNGLTGTVTLTCV